MLTAAGHSPLCENQREEVEMEDTGDAGAGTRATCHVPAEWGTRVTGAGAVLGLHGANLLQITPNIARSTHFPLGEMWMYFCALRFYCWKERRQNF